LDQWLLSGDPANASEAPEYDGPVCFHCHANVDSDHAHDAAGLEFCSTYCAAMIIRFEHREGCHCDSFGLTLEGAVIQ
jgi:hypothetical protein